MNDYRNPPIVEAVCEFRFSSDTPWEQDLPDRFYDAVRDHFPIRESRKGQSLEIKANATGIEKHTVETVDIPVFFTKDRKMLVQLGPRALSVHCLRPYPSWEVFGPTIRRAYEIIDSLTGGIRGFDRIGLLYVDKIEIPGETVRLEDYFAFYPHLGEGLPEEVVNFMVGCDFAYNDRDICRLKLTQAMPEKQNTLAYLLSTDYFLAQKDTVRPEDACAWVEEAHIKVKALFKGCITKKLEEIFDLEE
ncbi:TIGR04255 family protein [Methanofollis ethanolicus]|uniref:TIGR04255 family protein n=1 Tax=Methanofollis ethanolicus TaxID=488124 RepID=UPI00082DAFE1|nr:TIGR04255 family protein [Methanofollis ethanolicus]